MGCGFSFRRVDERRGCGIAGSAFDVADKTVELRTRGQTEAKTAKGLAQAQGSRSGVQQARYAQWIAAGTSASEKQQVDAIKKTLTYRNVVAVAEAAAATIQATSNATGLFEEFESGGAKAMLAGTLATIAAAKGLAQGLQNEQETKAQPTPTISALGNLGVAVQKLAARQLTPEQERAHEIARANEASGAPSDYVKGLREAETTGLPWQFNEGVNEKHRPKNAENQLEVISPHAIAAIRLLMLTGCRLSEILKLQWGDVDFNRGLLDLSDSKTGAKEVLLGAAALKVLAEIPRLKGNPYVIVGESKDRPRSDLKRPWKRITTHADLANLRLHDLRHSFASVGVASGMGLAVIGKLLGHASPITTARYAHIAEDASRRALNTIETTIAAGIGLPVETGEVIPLMQA